MKPLPPDTDGQNDDRAKWAQHGLRAFQQLVQTDDEDAISDLLADLMHLCDRSDDGSPSFEDELARARDHYESETMSPCSHTLYMLERDRDD